MGSGPRRSNLQAAPSRLTTEGLIHCPDNGEAPASTLEPSLAGEVGRLQLADQGLVLMVDGSAAASVHADPKLQACVRDGFEYAAVLEIRDEGPTVRFWQQ